MQKVTHCLVLLSSLLFSTQGFASHSVKPAGAAFDALTISVAEVTSSHPRMKFDLRWTSGLKTCEVAQGLSKSDPRWKSAPKSLCAAIRTDLIAHSKEIEKNSSNSSRGIPLLYGPSTGQLSFNDVRAPVNFQTAELCDVTLTRCEKPVLSAASLLGLKVRDRVIAQFKKR